MSDNNVLATAESDARLDALSKALVTHLEPLSAACTELLDGNIYALTPSVDFPPERRAALRHFLSALARSKGLRAQFAKNKEGDLIIQVVSRG